MLPVLSAAGCNTGACHGKSRGQNGFALSLLAFDPQFDYSSIALEAHGRRVFPSAPDNSLLLRKASQALPHGGGLRLKPGSAEYETVRRWIAGGLPRTPATAPTLKRIEVQPAERILAPSEVVQLGVLAHYSDGSIRDVTRLTDFQVNEPGVVSLSGGRITAGQSAGEATLMIRYMNNIATWTAAIPLAGSVDDQLYENLPRANFIDGLVWNKLRSQGITPSQPRRRQHVPAAGLPGRHWPLAHGRRNPRLSDQQLAVQARGAGRRTVGAPRVCRLLGQQMGRPAAAQSLSRGHQADDGLRRLDSRSAFRENLPYDQFVRQLLTAQGSAWRNGAATWFRDRRTPDEITPVVSQLFLGIRLECAKCHHHPFEVWSQDDFYSLAAYFARVTHKGAGHLAADLRRRGDNLRRRHRERQPSDHRQSARAAPAVRHRPADQRRRRPAGGLGRLDRFARQPVLCQGGREPGLGRPDGPRPGRTGRRPAGHQSAEQSGAARRIGRRLSPARLRPEEARFAASSPRRSMRCRRCPTSATSPTRATIRATTARGCGPRCCWTQCATSRACQRSLTACRREPAASRSGRTGSTRCSWTPLAGPTRIRIHLTSGRPTRRSCRPCT